MCAWLLAVMVVSFWLQVKLSSALKNFIAASTRSYGKVKLVLKHNKFWVETADTKVRHNTSRHTAVVQRCNVCTCCCLLFAGLSLKMYVTTMSRHCYLARFVDFS